jgi:hypothetical protein
VRACTTRAWAARSAIWRSGVLAGKSGVLFQPSRMAGDKFKVTACPYYDPGLDAVTDSGAALKASTIRTNAAAAAAVSGFFEVFRRANVHYIPRVGGVTLANMVGIQALYKQEAGLILNVVTDNLDEARYKNLLMAGLTALRGNAAHLTVHPCLHYYLR